MTESNAHLGRMVLKGLVGLKEQKGQITLDDVGGMFVQMATEHNAKSNEGDRIMHEEISRLAAYIDEANREIFAISTNEKAEDALMDASQHLDEVVKATEQASNSIMDAADIIQGAAGGIGGDKEKAIMDATTQIYGACNFQDITGQRINKVIKLLANIEQRVSKLNTLLSEVASKESKVAPAASGEVDLLAGPQHTGQGSSQAEIDALFASLTAKG